MNALEVLSDRDLFGPYFSPPETWAAWRSFLAALFALPGSPEDLDLYRRATGRSEWPTAPAREAWLACGRRSGKSRIAALVAVYLAAFRDYSAVLAPGEVGTVAIIAADRKQARTILRYVRGLLEHPALAPLVTAESEESVTLGRVVIEVHTASYRSVRGYTLVAALCDEIALWRTEDSASPDAEILAALRPGLSTTRGPRGGGLLLCLSNPYAKRGEMYKAFQRHHGRDGDPVLYWSLDTASMNPSIDRDVIAAAFEADPVAAWSEFGRDGEIRFRDDVASFVPAEVVDAATDRATFERPPLPGVRYVGFVDAASGTGADSMVLGIAHREEDGTAVLDVLAERRPPFSAQAACEAFADLLRRFRLHKVTGDRYGAGIMLELFSKAGIKLEHSERSRSDLYLDLLPLLSAGRARLLDGARLRAQLIGLERRTTRSGRDFVDAGGRNGHEDCANAAAGALVLAARSRRDCGVTIAPATPKAPPYEVEVLDPAALQNAGYMADSERWN